MSKPIHLKFEDNQEHQLLAIESTIRLFNGLPQSETAFALGDEIVPNLPPETVLDDNWLLANLNSVREKNGFEHQLSLDVEDDFELDGISNDSWRYPSFTLEMETGTGKTYVYLRTIFELKKRYGFRKFIVVVPSIAIYEGVIKNFTITRSHFRTLYGNEPLHLTPYDGQQLSKLRNFASSTFTEILVITLDSFNKRTNLIYKASEKLPGERKPFEYIQETRPIMILDEPQNMESSLARSALRTLHPLLAFRYSATHRTSPNLIYRLTPVEALKRNLVKRIQVFGVKEEFNYGQTSLALESLASYGLSAKIRTLINDKGVTKEAILEVKKGDDLYQKTKMDALRNAGFIIEEIDRKLGIVIFQNQRKLSISDSTVMSKEEVFKTQIEETVERHLQAQEFFKPKNIKVLSLFFIDKVANYTEDKGIVRLLFDKTFERMKRRSDLFKDFKAGEVRSAYFAKKKTRQGQEEAIDTSGRNEEERKAEKEAFKLIMRDKERLLSFDEKVSFIFAHSALGEGWDNPNVFQICTLRETRSELRKRQEIGRGLRLCVNQDGLRLNDEDINILTVVANDSYESYVRALQIEYTEDGEMAPPPPTNARKEKAKRNEKVFRSRDFKEFWKKLSTRTRYVINLNTDELVEKSIATLKATTFPEPQIVVTKGKFVITQYTLELELAANGTARIKVTITDTAGRTDSGVRPYSLRSDFQRILHDEALKGYRILSIKEDGIDSEVEFDNGQVLTKFNPLRFDSQAGQKIVSSVATVVESTFPVFNFVDRVAHETGLSRPTVNKIFKGMPQAKRELIFKNPESFTNTFLSKVKEVLADHIASKIEYVMEDAIIGYDLEALFPPEKKYPQKEVIPGNQRSIYDQVQYDSEVELKFVQNRLQHEDEVILYFKFPGNFKIGIPKIIGNYIPDWGVVRWTPDKQIKLHLIRETKGSLDPNLLQYPQEKRKIACATKHFKALGVDYRQITEDIPFWWKGGTET
ncbi:MAG: DEAD/DEAH box helicase family protein [bacterium]